MDEDHLNENETILHIHIPLHNENLREELNFYKELKSFFKEYNKPVEDIDFIISNIESNIDILSNENHILPDEDKLIKQIAKHPYFKNPGDYPIRLLTILKYLKKKGFNMHYKDIDIYIDGLIQKVDGVRKVGYGLYKKIR
ncbi:MAG: hypothetical protein GX285_08210 [Clostridiales bacterium]|nr:hypothetical protein [Clostridiales bacterium]